MPSRRPKYRTTQDIVIPAGSRIIHIAKMKHEIVQAANALVSIKGGFYFDFFMSFDEAMAAGLIEEISDDECPPTDS